MRKSFIIFPEYLLDSMQVLTAIINVWWPAFTHCFPRLFFKHWLHFPPCHTLLFYLEIKVDKQNTFGMGCFYNIFKEHFDFR